MPDLTAADIRAAVRTIRQRPFDGITVEACRCRRNQALQGDPQQGGPAKALSRPATRSRGEVVATAVRRIGRRCVVLGIDAKKSAHPVRGSVVCRPAGKTNAWRFSLKAPRPRRPRRLAPDFVGFEDLAQGQGRLHGLTSSLRHGCDARRCQLGQILVRRVDAEPEVGTVTPMWCRR